MLKNLHDMVDMLDARVWVRRINVHAFGTDDDAADAAKSIYYRNDKRVYVRNDGGGVRDQCTYRSQMYINSMLRVRACD